MLIFWKPGTCYLEILDACPKEVHFRITALPFYHFLQELKATSKALRLRQGSAEGRYQTANSIRVTAFSDFKPKCIFCQQPKQPEAFSTGCLLGCVYTITRVHTHLQKWMCTWALIAVYFVTANKWS